MTTLDSELHLLAKSAKEAVAGGCYVIILVKPGDEAVMASNMDTVSLREVVAEMLEAEKVPLLFGADS